MKGDNCIWNICVLFKLFRTSYPPLYDWYFLYLITIKTSVSLDWFFLRSITPCVHLIKRLYLYIDQIIICLFNQFSASDYVVSLKVARTVSFCNFKEGGYFFYLLETNFCLQIWWKNSVSDMGRNFISESTWYLKNCFCRKNIMSRIKISTAPQIKNKFDAVKIHSHPPFKLNGWSLTNK